VTTNSKRAQSSSMTKPMRPLSRRQRLRVFELAGEAVDIILEHLDS
jgi:hypothetical protein